MATDAVASVVLQKLSDLQVDKSFASNKIIGHCLRRVKETLEKISSAEAAEEETNEKIKKEMEEYLVHLYTIEDAIESFALRFTRQRKKLGFLMNHALFLKKFTALKLLNIKLCNIQTKVKKLNSLTKSRQGSNNRGTRPEPAEQEDDEFSSISEETEGSSSRGSSRRQQPEPDEQQDDKEMKHLLLSSIPEEAEGLSSSMTGAPSSSASMIRERLEHSKLMYSYSYNEEELPIVGYKRKVAELQDRLEKSDGRIIPLVGKLGSGKTMLARAVYGNRAITKMFGISAWANVFKKSIMTDILLTLLNQVKKLEVEDGSDEESLKHRLAHDLKGQKYLIVLNGVQTLEQWVSLKDAFPDQQNGSRIIITTCDKRVAEHAAPPSQIYDLESLNPDESWSLFMTKVGIMGSQPEPEASLKEKIIEVCQGLPLNIVLLGSLLSMKDSGKWSETFYRHREWQASDIMKLSYNDLDNRLKLCLIYMTLFPRELDIPVRRLQRLWLAEGFVEQEQDKFQEDVAQEYFEELVKRSLIVVSKQRSDGSARKCRLQGAIHDLLLEQAQYIHLFHVHPGSDGSVGMRRLVECADAGKVPPDASLQHVRSYISLSLQKKDTPARHVSSIVSEVGRGLGLLRVLDLEGVYQPSLPDNLGDLILLRCLGLRWTFLDKLPKSVGELLNLQTLDLKHTRIDKIPTTIWKLKNLQHLNLSEVHLDKDTPPHFRKSLPDLMTLWGLSVSHESPITDGLSKLENLRELGISFRFIKRNDDDSQGRGPSTEALVEWISKLKDLQSLRLRSKDDFGNPSDLSLRPFSNLSKLSHMELLGKLQQLPAWDQFPPRIKVLTLSLSSLSEDPMPILGQLPDLTVLRLLGNSYLGETMVCSADRFQNLEVLKLWKLEGLKKWEVEDGAMKKLKQVNIRLCSKLENFPSSLLQQSSFKDLILNDMPPAFKDKIDKKFQSKVSTKNWYRV